MKTDKKYFLYILIALCLLYIFWPHSFSNIMPGFYDEPIVKCEAVYCQQEVGDNNKPKYTTIEKEFEIGSEDYNKLMELLESATYRKQFVAVLLGGKRNAYSIPYPYAEIVFYQNNKMFEFSLFSRYLPAGPARDKYDYSPKGGKKFHTEVIEFIRTHGVVIDEEVKQY